MSGQNGEKKTAKFAGPCGCGENNPVRSDFIYNRNYKKAGARGQPGRVPGHICPGAGAGHHHFFQAGGVSARRYHSHAA